MPRARLIFVNRVYWPSLAATSQLLTDLAEGLAARGWDVHVIAAGNDASSHRGVTIHRTGEGVQHGGMISQARNYGRFSRRVQKKTKSLVQPGDVVVIMTDPPLLGAAITASLTKQGAQVIHWIQDIYPEIVGTHMGFPARALLFPLRLKRDAAWRQARACVVLGETMSVPLAQRGVDQNRIAIVPNWAPRELHTTAGPAAIATLRANWGLADKFVVAYSGNLGRVHEFAAILDAAAILKERPEFVFVFIGTGARLREVQSAIAARQLSNVRVFPPAPRSELAASLAGADVQLVTLRPDFAALVYPSKLAGVLAAGKPVIFVGPTPGEIATLLERSDCGKSVAAHDGAALAATLTEWQADNARRAVLSQNARRAYEHYFTFEAALNRWEKILTTNGAR